MTSICIYFQIHQPYRLRWFWPDGDNGFNRYFDESINKEIFEKVARKCYLPTNNVMLDAIDEHYGEFKFSVSITGTLLSQCEKWGTDVLDTFRQMADSGCVEFLDETNYHSLAGLFEDRTEFIEQVREHRDLVFDLLKVKPEVFRNTELLYNNSIAKTASDLGYKAILTEGLENLLGWRTPNHVYKAKDSDIAVLMRNFKLSDDIGYRFSAKWWGQYPLTADKWATWASEAGGETINIFMDYETFGEHQWETTGIFQFLRALPDEVIKRNLTFNTPSEVVDMYKPVAEIDVGDFSTISWADMERDTSAWLGNDMQRRCFEEAKQLGPYVKKTGDKELLRIWKHLLTSDHYYYMCTKWLDDGDVHSYFSIHSSPFDAAVNFMAVIMDFKAQVFKRLSEID
ncbi:MAG: glycoside hydrolase family 57 protein [Methanosarcinaceae archaeon]|nr:glycoside hydrolase family 57 protein [Methanosarcinaceae archaeon]MDF1533400.1 glycoside hydrolase family 57 protein [Methanosarcinaceae archaeon]